MSKTIMYFIAGAILSPLVLVSLKLLIFIAGIIAIVWTIQTIVVLINEDKNDSGTSDPVHSPPQE